jgi:hypothetical protein
MRADRLCPLSRVEHTLACMYAPDGEGLVPALWRVNVRVLVRAPTRGAPTTSRN